ncbi:MAG TPA: Gfo/Idh/MocA family oxidoreductase [Pirellulales bacterium]|nr:Gfo/Idh/MocA family oxidoreductase [Pirellulales bacterium]
MADKFRAAVIGSTGRGNYGHGLDVVWRDIADAELVAVADDNPAGLAAALVRLKLTAGYTDYRKLLDEVKPDVVSIAPRWIDRHHEMAMACLERGIHVYMEKPFCRTLAEADEIVDTCDRTHTKLVTAHQTAYSPRVDVAKKLIADGKIGDVLEYRGRGKEDRRGGGEDLWVLGTHIMGLIRIFGGDPLWCFGRVSQSGQPITAANVTDGPEGIGLLAGDDVRAMYGMPDGTTAYFASRRHAGGHKARFGLQIFGTQGAIEIATGHMTPTVKYLPDPSWMSTSSGEGWLEVTTAGIGQPEPIPDGGLHGGNILAINDLLAAVRENREPRGNAREARGNTQMIVAVFASQVAGGPVTLPLSDRGDPLAKLQAAH